MRTLLLFYLVIFSGFFSAKAQLSSNDSLFFNSVFTSQMYMANWIYPGTFYLKTDIQSRNELFSTLDTEFKFSSADYTGSYKKIKTDTSLQPLTTINNALNNLYGINPNWGYRQTNPCFKLPFMLKDKSSNAYTTFTPTTATVTPTSGRTAFLIFPGSGDNMTTETIQGVGYNNLQCQVKNYLLPYGDVFIQIRPLQDIRSYNWNQKRFMCEFPTPSQTVGYLASKDKFYGINVLIESIALTKYLKKKYDKVVILGLSYGGEYCLMNSFESQPDGVLVSGGYTVEIDALYETNAYQLPHFGSLFYSLFQRDTILAKVQASNSEFLFSWGTGGDIEEETVNHATENYFAGLTNTQYYYNYTGHTFPSCPAYNKLMDSINKRAKPVIRELSSTCNPPVVNLLVKFFGKKPFTFDLYRNNVLQNSYACPTDSIFLNVNNTGTFQIRNLLDSTGNVGFKSDEFEFNPNENINIQLASSEYICDSNKYLQTFSLDGDPYWDITYSKNGILDTIKNLYSNSLIAMWEPGQYIIHSIKDNGGCIKPIGDTINIKATLTSNDIFKSVKYDCDSSKTKFELSSAFSNSVRIRFLKNGVADSIPLSSPVIYLGNGDYTFTRLVSGNGCNKNIFIPYLVNEAPLSITDLGSKFICDSNSTELTYKMTGKSPWQIYYKTDDSVLSVSTLTDTARWLVSNGLKLIHTAFDNNGCVIAPFIQKNIYDTLSTWTLNQKLFYCDSNKTKFVTTLTGRSPWKFYFTRNGLSDSLEFTHPQPVFFLANGNYMFNKLVDSNKCEFLINTPYTLMDSAITYQFIGEQYNCLTNHTELTLIVSGRSPYLLSYFSNGLANTQSFTSSPVQLDLSNGNYFISNIKDSNNCQYSINEQRLIHYDPIQVSASSPVFDCDTVKSRIDYHFEGNAPFTVQYVKDIVPMTFTSAVTDTSFYYSNGLFNIETISDETGCTMLLNNSYLFNFDTLKMAFGPPLYNCDSNKTKIHFELEGNSPFTISYYRDLLAQQMTVNQNSFDRYFGDGNYFFYKIVDNTGCSIDTNLMYSFSFQPMSATIIQQAYNCDSNKYEIQFAFTGNAPWELEYTDGTNVFTKMSTVPTMKLFLNNGNWMLNNVSNNAGCIDYLNTPLSLAFNQISAAIVNQVFDCDSNKLRVQFLLTGNSPWYIHYVKNGIIPTYYYDTTYNTNHAVYLPSGSYTFLNVIDSTGCNNAALFQTALNNYNNLGIQEINRTFDCDSVKIRIDYQLNGDAPWEVSYQNNSSGIVSTIQSTNSLLSLFLSNADYSLLSIQDANCLHALSDTIQVNYTALTSAISPMDVLCDSGKNRIRLISHGGEKPYLYEYYFNGISGSINTSNDTIEFILTNGNYLFTKITDANGCSIIFNQNLIADYDHFTLNNISSSYSCTKDSTEINFDLMHQTPIWLTYTKDGGAEDTLLIDLTHSFFFGNGTYQFLNAFDGRCTDTIGQKIVIDNEPVSSGLISIEKNCEDRTYRYHFSLEGSAPWSLYFNLNNIFDTLLIPTAEYFWTVPAGAYYLIQLKDANDCEEFIGHSDSLVDFLPESPSLQLINNQFIAITDGYKYVWYRNEILIDSTTKNSMPTMGDGEYYVVIYDEAGCMYATNKISVSYPSLINAFPNPTSDVSSVLIDGNFGAYWGYEVSDMQGNTILQGKETKAYKELDLRSASRGVYNLIIVFELDKTKHVMRLIKQ